MQNNLTMAYLGAYFQRVKKMPTLKSLLEDSEKKTTKRGKTSEQMFEEVKRLNAALGGTVY